MSRTLVALACFALSPLASAATFIVDTTSDAVLDTCDAGSPDDCSLRGAIGLANANADADTITFAIPETDPGYQSASAHWRIAPATALPDVQTGPLTIDGFTQPGAIANTNPTGSPIDHTLKIELRGPNLNNVNCLQAVFASLTVRGLAINNCNQAIYLFEGATHVVEGNYIGTDITGEVAVPNRFGVALGGDVQIGGTTPAQGNVISGNLRGALVQFRQLTRLRVQGNTLGPNASQTGVPGIQDYGLQLNDLADAVIGGTTAAEANVISGNAFNAIYVFGSPEPNPGAPDLRVLGNLIGVTFNGDAMGNGLNPVSPSQVVPAIQIAGLGYCRVEIGGSAAGEGNLIAYSGGAGVAVSSCWSAPILGNSFLGNRGQAIDLAGSNNFDGPTPNDPGDADGTGADPFGVFAGNRFQNHPVIDSLTYTQGGSTIEITYHIDSETQFAAYPLRVDIMRGRGGQPEGHVASDVYSENDAQLPKVVSIPAIALQGQPLILGATDAEGNSSEFMAFDELFSDGFEDDGNL
ncbi:MAG: hypothetical protein F9K31_01895 [Dokdonella sp.]|nr:MAG: hypothetical protein F9K31_01895 [Dokdonella sp.]